MLLSVTIFLFVSVCFAHAEIIYLKGGGMMKGQILEKKSDSLTLSVKYGAISLTRKEVDKISEDSDPDAILDLARYYVSKEEWENAVEEFDNLLLIKPEMRDEVLNYLSDVNFTKSAKSRRDSFKNVTEAYQLIEEGKMLVNFGQKQLKYKSGFADEEFQKKIHAIAKKNISKGEAMIKKGQSVIDSYHRQRDEEIRKAREKDEQEAKEKKGKNQ
jgi:PHD/YefM family antitoxin component YafN of YafNO toxin-antitoxin module